LELRAGDLRRQIQAGVVDRPQGRHRPRILDDDDILALAGLFDQAAEFAARFGYGTSDRKITLIVHETGTRPMAIVFMSDRGRFYRS